METHELAIAAVTPWANLNEYEGEVVVVVDGAELHCRLVLPKGDWHTLQPGGRITAALYLVRSAELAPSDAPPSFRHLGGLTYEAIGRVERIDGDHAQLACGRLLDVDLSLTPAMPAPAVGATLRVVGMLELEPP